MADIDTNELFYGVVLGLLGGFLIFYSVRTEVPYPAWLLSLYEEPLIRIGIFLAVLVVSLYDLSLGVLMALIVVFLHTDVSLANMYRSCLQKGVASLPYKRGMALDGKKKEASDSESEKKESFVVTGHGSPFGRSVEQVISAQIRKDKDGTVISSPHYPLTDPSDELLPGSPASYPF